MRVWLIKVGEPLPGDIAESGGREREYRMGLIARQLLAAGHEVEWWSSTFDHRRKTHRAKQYERIEVEPGYQLHLLPSPGYHNNVSLARLYDHAVFADCFSRHAADSLRPDLIFCALPTIDLCQVATQYGRHNGIPVVLDVRDLWPDIFQELVPGFLRPFSEIGMRVLRRKVGRACRDATGLVGITPRFVEWATTYAGRPVGPNDESFPLAYPEEQLPQSEVQKALEKWRELGLDDGQFVASAILYLGHPRFLDMAPVLDAARRLAARDANHFRIVICGDGEGLPELRRQAAGLPTVLFPGWAGAAEIRALLELSSVGLVPYASTFSFKMSYPNKVFEYMSAGLPIISQLQGQISELLAGEACGLTVGNADGAALAKAIVECDADPIRLGRMGNAAKALYRRSFAAERVYSELVKHLEGVYSRYKDGGKSPTPEDRSDHA